MMKPWFNVRKAAQIAAYFAMANGGPIDVLKLVKLAYLANRKAMEMHDYPLLNDQLVSMEHGPVNSMMLNCINGLIENDDREVWSEFVKARVGNSIVLARNVLVYDDFDEMSIADLEVLKATWNEFGALTTWAIRDYTHDHCPEWEDPQGSSEPIPYERVFKFLNKEDSDGLAQQIIEQRRVQEAFARYRK